MTTMSESTEMAPAPAPGEEEEDGEEEEERSAGIAGDAMVQASSARQIGRAHV